MKRREALKLMAASVPIFATVGCTSLMDKQPMAASASIKTLGVT